MLGMALPSEKCPSLQDKACKRLLPDLLKEKEEIQLQPRGRLIRKTERDYKTTIKIGKQQQNGLKRLA